MDPVGPVMAMVASTSISNVPALVVIGLLYMLPGIISLNHLLIGFNNMYNLLESSADISVNLRDFTFVSNVFHFNVNNFVYPTINRLNVVIDIMTTATSNYGHLPLSEQYRLYGNLSVFVNGLDTYVELMNTNFDVLQDFYNNYHGYVPAYFNENFRSANVIINAFIERAISLVENFRNIEMSLLLSYILNGSFRDLS